ncbi:hypothetical protein RBSH_00382 [Rhodopirellula baltica SH28]|uniref:Uncharacterized protein n=1 Tax=Rhodopirellula baltica SH28 TaxID=993517 RepID=K5CJV3_RHOBT|nr:hypothetical protein RBSH_00382 [Rhodopirellula baltica SH28]
MNQANAATKQATIPRLVNEIRLQALAAQNPEMQEAVKGYLPSPNDLTQDQ